MTNHRQQKRYQKNHYVVVAHLHIHHMGIHAEIDRIAREEIEQGRGFLLLNYENYHAPY